MNSIMIATTAISSNTISLVVIGLIAFIAIALAVSMTFVLWKSLAARRSENMESLPDLVDIDPELRKEEAMAKQRESAFDVEEIKFDMDDLDEDANTLLSEAYREQSRGESSPVNDNSTKGFFSRKK